MPYFSNTVVSAKSPHFCVLHALVALKLLVSLISCLVACSARIVVDDRHPGAKVRVITREARYTHSRHSMPYFASSRSARGYVRRRNFAQSRVKIISARQFKGAHERCVKAACPFTRVRACSRAISRVSMVNTFVV